MTEIAAVEQEQQCAGWRERFRYRAKKLSKRMRKALKYSFLCTASCGKRGDDTSAVVKDIAKPAASVSVGIQTDVPFIVDQLRHRGETMKHRAPLNYIPSEDHVINDSQSGSPSNSQQPIGTST